MFIKKNRSQVKQYPEKGFRPRHIERFNKLYQLNFNDLVGFFYQTRGLRMISTMEMLENQPNLAYLV